MVIEDKDYFDGKTIFPEEFYEILRSGKDIKTYHINALYFIENFLPYAQNGDEVIYICFSTGIANSIICTNSAKNKFWRNIQILTLPLLIPNVHPWDLV